MSEEAAADSGDDPDLDPDHSPDLSHQFTFASWTGPKFIFKKVHKWSVKDWGKSPRGSIGWFLQYCWAFCESEDEEDEMFVWMLSLLSLYVKEDGWDGFCQGALKWNWNQVALRDDWEIPAPVWAKRREEEDIINGMVVKIGEEDEVKNEVKNDVKKVGVKEDDVKGDEVKEDYAKEDEVKEGDVREDEVKEDGKNEDEVKEDGTKEDYVNEDYVKENDVKEEEVKEYNVKEDVMKADEAKKDGVKEDDMKEDQVKENDVKDVLKEETMGEVASPSSSWGSQLPPETPKTSALPPTWRPWENQWLLKWKKKRSPASEARSQHRLREWQRRRDLQRDSSLLAKECFSTPLPPSREMRNVRLTARLEGVKGCELGSQAPAPCQWSGSQTFPAFPSWPGSTSPPPTPSASPPLFGSQTFSTPPPRSGSQTYSTPPPWSGSQTYSTPPPWSGHQGNAHQDYRLSASTSHNPTMLQQPSPPLVTLPSPIPGFLPSPLSCQAGSVNGSTWGLLPALVTACPSCHAWGLLTPSVKL